MPDRAAPAPYLECLFPQIADPKKRAFLAAYAYTGRITQAAKSSQVGWRNHYNWVKDDPEYAEAFATAQAMAGDWLEDEAIRRAKEGIEKKIFYLGEHIDNQTEYSDTLLIFLLKGAKPEKYRDREQKDHGRVISELLEVVLREFAGQRSLRSVQEAEWAPLTPGAPPGLPAPPAPDEVVPKAAPVW